MRGLIHRFAWCIDRRDWDGFRNVLADEVDVTLDSTVGDSPAGPVPAGQQVEQARDFFDKLDATHHHLTVYRIDLADDGRSAEVLTYFRAGHFKAHVLGGGSFDQAGHYEQRCVRTTDGWRLAGWRQFVAYTQGNAKLLARGGDGTPGDD